jgi:hypothetical protein
MGAGVGKRKQVRRTETQWRELIAAWKASGKTKQTWCRENGVSFESLRRWKKRLGQSDGNPPLVQLLRKPIVLPAETPLRIRVTREGELEITGAISEEIIRSLLRFMREPSRVR